MNDVNNSMTPGVAPVAGQSPAAATTPMTDVTASMPGSAGDAPPVVAPMDTSSTPTTVAEPIAETPANVGVGAAAEEPQVVPPTPAGLMNSNEGTDTDSGSSAPPVAGM